MMDDVNKRHFLWCLMRYNSIDSSILSCTGFQILMCDKVSVLKSSNIFYYMNFLIQVMIIESLKLVTLVCVFDQAIYSKAIEIKWKEKQKFGNIVLMMGMFNMLMMYMHILSKRVSDAGIRDILLQSGTIAAGSVEKALRGKTYNRCQSIQNGVRSNR